MLKFIVRRIFWTIPVLLVVILLTFMMMRQIGGQPVPADGARGASGRAGATWSGSSTSTSRGTCSTPYYVKGVFTFDLGPSLVLRGRDVNDIVKEHFPKSIELGFYAFLFAIVVGVPLGVIAALRHNTAVDYAAMFFSNVVLRRPELPARDAADLLLRAEVRDRRLPDERLDDVAEQGPARRSRSASGRWRSSPGSCAGRCSRRCSRTTCAPRGPRACATGASSGCTCCGTR